MVDVRRRFTDGNKRSSCPASLFNYGEVCSDKVFFYLVLTMRWSLPRQNRVKILSNLVHHRRAHSPLILSVEMPDAKSTSDNPTSSEGNRRTIGKWFRTVMTKRSHNPTPCQMPSDAPPQSGIPSQTKATPQNKQPSMASPSKRQKGSVVPFAVATGGYLTIRPSGRGRKVHH